MPIENPDDLQRVDQEIRINELKAEAEELTGGEMATFEADDAPPELVEQFWQNVVEYEKAELTSGHKQLAEDGLVLPPPDEVAEADLPDLLREMMARLAKRCTYVYNTDHLSDRQLYEDLWNEALNEAFADMPHTPGDGGWFIDILGGCSEEDIYLSFKYYADEKERKDWLEQWPDYDMPPHEAPPYDRDRHLPKPPQTPDGPKWF